MDVPAADVPARDTRTIRGRRLTSWAACPDGERVQVGFEDEAGRSCAISLPVEVLSALMMTIPRMLRQALKRRFPDGSLRMIHPLGDWRVEKAAGADTSILSLATPDGFEVAFAVGADDAERLGAVLRRFNEADAGAPTRSN
jgi:hypothetical protein